MALRYVPCPPRPDKNCLRPSDQGLLALSRWSLMVLVSSQFNKGLTVDLARLRRRCLSQVRACAVTEPCFGLQCLFAHSLRKFSMRDWGIEQKWMSVLLPLLLLYNGRCRLCSGVFPFEIKGWRTSEGWPGPGLQKHPGVGREGGG